MLRLLRCSLSAFRPSPAIRTINSPRLLSSSAPRSARYVRFSPDPQDPFNISKWNIETKIVVGLAAGATVYYLSHLEKMPETGRWRFMDISPKFEAKLAKAAYNEIIQEYGGKIPPPDHLLTRHIHRVVSRILEANDLGTLRQDSGSLAPSDAGNPEGDRWAGNDAEIPEAVGGGGGKDWNLVVVHDEKTVNAAASFGNIIVFTGILPVCKDEEGLAAVFGHEIAHSVLRHVPERCSSSRLFVALGWLLDALGLDIGIARILTTFLLELPNSRTAELEADAIGLQLASKACYDPNEAIQ